MKYRSSATFTKKLLPVALAAFGLSGCGGEQLGGTNDGLSGGLVGAETLLLIGGIVGVGSIINSDSDDSGVVVQPVGDSSVDGSNNGGGPDNNGDGSDNGNNNDNGSDNVSDNNGNSSGDNGSDDADGADNDGADNSDGSAGFDDSDSNDSNGTEATEVPFLQPPDWLLGMWTGTGSNGVMQTGFATSSDMGVSLAGNPMSGYSHIHGVCFHILEDSGNAFVYTVWYPLADGTEVLFNERWVNNGDGSVFYRASGAKSDEFIMHQTPATSFLQPPLWLQGSWASESENGIHNIVRVNDGNIVISENNNHLNHYNVAKHPDSVFQVLEDSQSSYSYRLTSVDTHGELSVVSAAFHNTSANTITYTRYSDDNQSTFHLERQ